MKVQLVTRTEGVGKYSGLTSEEIVAAIARHGVIKEDKGKLVKYLMEKKHWSPLDMIDFGFEIETSRDIGRQLLRHWSIKPQEHSQRYSSKVSFEKIEIRKEDTVNRQSSTEVFDPYVKDERFPGGIKYSALLELTTLMLEEVYLKGIKAGVAKECARGILPGCTTTVMTMKGSLRSWLAFLNVRCDHHAQKECQLIAFEIGKLLEIAMPNVFKAIDWKNGMFM